MGKKPKTADGTGGRAVCEFQAYRAGDGIDLYVYPTRLFKSLVIKVYVYHPLGPDATRFSLLSHILRRGCRRWVNMRKIVIFLEQLYGASMSMDVSKIGNCQHMSFHMEIVHERLVPHGRDHHRKALQFLKSLIMHPVREKGVLKKEYIAQEKVNLKNTIEGMINDRRAYAYERCLQEMFRDDPYGLYEYGRLEDLDGITPKDLTEFHEQLVTSAPMDIFVTGDVRPDRMASMVHDLFDIRKRRVRPVTVGEPYRGDGPVREIVEEKDVEQGKLMIGCRTDTTWSSPDIMPMIFYSAVLGGFPHSKLFKNVRERDGLAYSVNSNLEYTKGTLFIHAGIDFAKYEPALRTIREQMDDIAAGRITDEEFHHTRMSLLDRLRSRQDTPSRVIHSFLEMLANRHPIPQKEFIAALERVTPKDVARAAEKVKIDTLYYLTRKKG